MKTLDVISRQIEHVRPTDFIEEAVLIMFSGSTNVIPVCLGKRLVGTISQEDILNYLFRPKEKDWEVLQKTVHSAMGLTINKIMNKNPITVGPDSELSKVLSMMQEKSLEKIPVVDREKRLLGMVSKENVLKTLINKNFLFPESNSKIDFFSNSNKTIEWKDRLKHEIPDLLRILKANNCKTILDIGCGTGEHAITLAKNGFDVVGVERNSELFNKAIKNRNALPTKEKDLVKFVNSEIEDYLFDLENKFDAILFMGNTISYNPTFYRIVIKKATNALSKNGVLVFQITNFEKAINVSRRLINFDTIQPKEDKKREYAFLEFLDKPFRGRLIAKNTISLLSEKQNWQWAGITNTTMVYLDQGRIVRLLKNEGFSKIEIYGGSFDGRHWDYLFRKPFEELESDWLNIVATKK